MTDKRLIRTSKFLAYVLRHHPESIGLELDPRGWAHLPSLIEKANRSGKNLSRELIRKIIDNSEKQRFRLSDDGSYIRAGYGHSVDVDLELEPQQPPDLLYHGTARHNLDSILEQGLHPAGRNLVHLSANRKVARAVGSRHGKPHILEIRARQMYESGHSFYRSDSEPGIWLTEKVPPGFIDPKNDG